MAMEIEGKVTHYPSSQGVIFNFQTTTTDKDGVDTIKDWTYDLAFEIWSKYKDSKVKVIIDKVK